MHILALSHSAVIVRHWFEINLDDASMEHGVRIELRELSARPHRGSESAAECFALTRDAQESVQLMIEYLRRPDLLDADRVSPWMAAG